MLFTAPALWANMLSWWRRAKAVFGIRVQFWRRLAEHLDHATERLTPLYGIRSVRTQDDSGGVGLRVAGTACVGALLDPTGSTPHGSWYSIRDGKAKLYHCNKRRLVVLLSIVRALLQVRFGT